MADNRQVRDGNDILFTGATKENSDSSHSPKVALTDGSGSPAPISPAKSQQFPAALTALGNLKVANQEQPRTTTTSFSSVAQTAAGSVSILPADGARAGATIYNAGTSPLLLLLGAGPASASVFTIKMAADGYYELPFGYTGVVTGIWTAAGAGAARCTSVT